MILKRTFLLASLGFGCVSLVHSLGSDLGDRVLVIYSERSAESRKVAEYYISRRHIPVTNLCRIKTDTISVSWDEFERTLRKPIKKCLDVIGRDSILYLVLSYETPYALSDVPTGYGRAIDGYLADLWDHAGMSGRTLNPYFNRERQSTSKAGFVSLADYRSRGNRKLVYSVWRLDAPSASLARGLIDKAIEAEDKGLTGQACIDRRFGKDMTQIEDSSYGSGDWDLFRAAELLRHAGIPVIEDSGEAEFGTTPAPARCDGAIFYAGWYSLNHYNDAFSWKIGALGVHLDSLSAADPRGGDNWSANAIKKGLAVTSGAVDEPGLQGLVHVDGVIHDLLEGANVGDAFLRNTLWLRWMIINIGDPLYRPKFGTGP